jgi:hypothetical protein
MYKSEFNAHIKVCVICVFVSVFNFNMHCLYTVKQCGPTYVHLQARDCFAAGLKGQETLTGTVFES